MSSTLTFLIGLAGLLIAGHVLIDGAGKIGRRLGMAPGVIGLTIVAAGTSAPELAVFYQAVRADDTSLAVGSIIGSNIANVLLVVGVVACMGAVKVSQAVVQVDVPVMAAASAALLVMTLDRNLSRLDGVLLVCGIVCFIVWTIRTRSGAEPSAPAASETGEEPTTPPRPNLLIAVASIVIGVAGLTYAAGFVVTGAEEIALALGVPELIVGLTILALGTSAPEIATSIVAAVRGNRQLALGNAVGSNIFNILLVLGLSSSLSGGISFGDDAVRLDMPILVAAAVACMPVLLWDHSVDRWEGFVFVALYGAYLVFLALDGTDRLEADPFVIAFAVFVVPLGLLTGAVVIAKTVAHRRLVAAPSTEPQPGR